MTTFDPAAISLLALLAITLPLSGVFMAVTPYLMPKRECFAVTIPNSAADDPRIKQLKRSYCLDVLAATALLTAATIACMLFSPERAFIAAFTVSILVLCIGSYALMLRFRLKTQTYKEERGWKADSDKRIGFVAEEAPEPLSMKWDLLFLPAVLIAAVMAATGYSSMPEQIPMQISLSGEVSNWAEKSLAIAAFPALLSAFLGACFAFSHWSIVRSKKGIDAARPAASAWAYGAFARAQSKMLVGLGTMLSFIGPLVCLSSCGAISMQQALLPLLVMIAVAIIATGGVGLVYGQNGSRLLAKMKEPDGMPADDDRHWKLGIIYWNSEDASLFVPARFGIGWTANLGRPAAWALIAAFTLVVAAFVAFSVTL